jgi:hypothetical protein
MRGLLQIQLELIMPDFESNKAETFKKGGSYVCALLFKPSMLLAKGKLMSLVWFYCLSKNNITFNGI